MDYELLAQVVSPGNYIAIWKLAAFAVLFGLWAWTGQWVNQDTRVVNTNQYFWNYIYIGLGMVGLLAWFLVPAGFLIIAPVYVVIWLATAIVYILHRNNLVEPEERVMTLDFFKHAFSGSGKSDKKTKQRVLFISSNGNELPLPKRQDAEYDGYVVAEDIVHSIYLRRASITELVPGGEVTNIRLAIDGVISDGGERDRGEMDQAISYLKAVAGLDVKERRRPQNSSFSIRVAGGDKIEWQMRTSGSTRGEHVVLERVEQAVTLKTDELGLNADQKELFENLVQQRPGIMLITGMPGSGVTSTMYAVLRRHDAFTTNINTVEFEPLTDLDNITQHLLDKGTGPTECTKRVQGVLRSEPDILMVDFCSDAEMAKSVSKSCEEGKKIYVRMEKPSTFHALEEWINMVGKPGRVANTLVAITNQKLVRKLCPACREAYAPEPKMLRRLNLPADKIKQFFRPPTEIEYDKHGDPILCENCQGVGYYGRTAVFEILVINDNVKKMIIEGAGIADLRAQCRKDRMLYLQEQALLKVLDGTTSIQEILRVTTEKPTQKQQAAPEKQ